MADQSTTKDNVEASPNSRATEMWDNYRTETIARHDANQDSFDKAILTYSTGALALSLGFLKDFALNSPEHLCWRYASWVVFVLCVTATIASFLVGGLANQRAIELRERYYVDGDREARDLPNYAHTATVF